MPLFVGQVAAWAEAVPRRNRAMVIAQAGLGLRIGEPLSLRVQDVDFMRRTVRVEWQIAPGAKVRSVPKTRRSTRTVPLPQVVAESLSVHLTEFPPGPDGDGVGSDVETERSRGVSVVVGRRRLTPENTV